MLPTVAQAIHSCIANVDSSLLQVAGGYDKRIRHTRDDIELVCAAELQLGMARDVRYPDVIRINPNKLDISDSDESDPDEIGSIRI